MTHNPATDVRGLKKIRKQLRKSLKQREESAAIKNRVN